MILLCPGVALLLGKNPGIFYGAFYYRNLGSLNGSGVSVPDKKVGW